MYELDDDVDFSVVHTDDWYLDHLGRKMLPVQEPFDALTMLLLNWRHEIDDEPIPPLFAAEEALAAARRRRESA
jgi:hypothetical protein